MKSLLLWPLRLLERLLVAVLVFLCRFWQILVSPLVGARCRFYPTCSHYAVESLHKHGLLRGCLLTLGRIARCHPLARGGIDPVPDRGLPAGGQKRDQKSGGIQSGGEKAPEFGGKHPEEAAVS